jgi:lipoprotein-releasing system permease protein
MYKILLCWRYLLTRYLAFVCIISVMLGVATLIVVNSVMGGFSNKLRERLHGLLSDIVVESRSMDGFPYPERMMAKIRQDPELNERIVAMTATMETYAMLQFEYQSPNGGLPQIVNRTVRVIGVEPGARSTVGGFKEHLVKQYIEPREKNPDIQPGDLPSPTFELRPEVKAKYLKEHFYSNPEPPGDQPVPLVIPKQDDAATGAAGTAPPAPTEYMPPPKAPPSAPKIPRGIIVGHMLAHIRVKNKETDETSDLPLLGEGGKVILTMVSGGNTMNPVYDQFLVVDYFKSEMSEYDSNYVFVPLDHLQHLRTMQNRVTTLQIKLKNYDRDSRFVKERLAEMFPEEYGFVVDTWEDKQGPLLAAISIERGILNVLLFMIIGVAGFGILSIFTMIVAEKTRDIGIMKALGASNRGVMAIFLTYGLLLGVVGAGLGTLLGVSMAVNINDVESFLTWATGHEVFDRQVYYFNEIPTEIQPWNILLLNLGAVAIAVLFSVLPALRAAMLHPVRALRYE